MVGPHGESVCSVEHEVPVGLGGGLDDLRPGLRLPRPLPLQQQDHRRVREEDCRASLFLDTADYFLQWKDLPALFPIPVILATCSITYWMQQLA